MSDTAHYPATWHGIHPSCMCVKCPIRPYQVDRGTSQRAGFGGSSGCCYLSCQTVRLFVYVTVLVYVCTLFRHTCLHVAFITAYRAYCLWGLWQCVGALLCYLLVINCRTVVADQPLWISCLVFMYIVFIASMTITRFNGIIMCTCNDW